MNKLLKIAQLSTSAEVEAFKDEFYLEDSVRQRLAEIFASLFEILMPGCVYEFEGTNLLCVAHFDDAPGYYIMVPTEHAGKAGSVPYTLYYHPETASLHETLRDTPELIFKALSEDPAFQSLTEAIRAEGEVEIDTSQLN